MRDVHDSFIAFFPESRRDLDAAQMPCVVEQAQLISDFSNSESQPARVGPIFSFVECQLQVVQLLLSVAVRPPQPRLLHGELFKFSGRELQLVAPGGRVTSFCKSMDSNEAFNVPCTGAPEISPAAR